ncbi:MAG: hypothetical protein QM689_04415 [Oscillospiraceae bacterium]
MLTIGTDSYITVADADGYISGHYRSNNLSRTRWEALPEEDREILLRQACAAIETLPFHGRKANPAQKLAFPRLPFQYGNAEDAPDSVKNAQAELALWLSDDTKQAEQAQRQELQAQGVTSFSVGDLSENYGATQTKSPAELCAKCAALLAPWLNGGFGIC